MTVHYVFLLPKWMKEPGGNPAKLEDGVEARDLSAEELEHINSLGYNAYWLPNYPSTWDGQRNTKGLDVDVFDYVFVDMDLKEKKYASKDAFIERLGAFPLEPTMIVDSGNGLHAYWRVTDLTVMDYLRIQRRLCRALDTDEATGKIHQLMRVWGTLNTKERDNYKPCELLLSNENAYDGAQLDEVLPRLSAEDEAYCKNHHDITYGLVEAIPFDDKMPDKWFKQFPKGSQGYSLLHEKQPDRSEADWKLAHLLLARGFTKEEAMSVLVNTEKAAERRGQHRINYAQNMVTKIWTAVVEGTAPGGGAVEPEVKKVISRSIRQIKDSATSEELKGTRFPCNQIVDATKHGFRLTQVLGLIGGAGSGKTTWALNLFMWFIQNNPDYIHLFVSLEQPEGEISERWRRLTNDNEMFYDNVHVLGNYNEDGTYRELGIHDIEKHIKLLESETGRKVGCVVIDHIGVLKTTNTRGEFMAPVDICRYMKALAKNTNTFLIMQSQTSREKAGDGDLELDKDAAFGTTLFEWFCDYVVTIWQPLKRIYAEHDHMTVTCFKYCKIRHKDQKVDKLKEGSIYALHFDTVTENLRLLTQDEQQAFKHFEGKAIAARNRDKRRDGLNLQDITWTATPMAKKDSTVVNMATYKKEPGNK